MFYATEYTPEFLEYVDSLVQSVILLAILNAEKSFGTWCPDESLPWEA